MSRNEEQMLKEICLVYFKQGSEVSEATHLRNPEIPALVEEAVEVDVDGVAVAGVEEDVLAVTVAETQQVADHRHHSRRASVGESGHVPSLRITPSVGN